MNLERHRGLLPHYVANLVLVLLGVSALRAVAGDVGIAVELVVVVVVVLAYPTLVRWLGVAPDAWTRAEEP